MASKAADFYASTVKPTISEFLSKPWDIRRGRLAAIVLYHMVDYLAFDGYPRQGRGEMDKRLNVVREELTSRCPDFAPIRDIGDVTKHSKLSISRKAPPREISSSQQITGSLGIFHAPFGEGVFAEAASVFATLEDGTIKPVEPAIVSVMTAIDECLGHAAL